MHKLMLRTPDKSADLGLDERMRLLDRLVPFSFIERRQLAQHMFMHAVKDSANRSLVRIIFGIG
jgi:hypothetical protein